MSVAVYSETVYPTYVRRRHEVVLTEAHHNRYLFNIVLFVCLLSIPIVKAEDVKVIKNNIITLRWDAPTQNTDGSVLENLSGYKIYWWTENNSNRSMADVGISTVSRIYGLIYGEFYFFAVSAYSDEGLESDTSTVIRFHFKPEYQKLCVKELKGD